MKPSHTAIQAGLKEHSIPNMVYYAKPLHSNLYSRTWGTILVIFWCPRIARNGC